MFLCMVSVVIQKPFPVLYKMDRDGFGDLLSIDAGKGGLSTSKHCNIELLTVQ
jgi:hypothetical protein